jgi:nitrite reductase (NO-forming)
LCDRPVAVHIGNAMYGMILVEPKEGLPKVDHEYYLGSTVGDKALTANVGENVRLFVGDGGPNLVSQFQLIG